MKPIEPLFERDGLPRFGLPAALATSYGGDFGLARPTLYANFVSAVDGVVALPGPGESGGVVSGGSEPDRVVMGLLRAAADAVLVGAGTFRAGAGDLWHPETAFPAARDLFSELRKQLRKTSPERPHQGSKDLTKVDLLLVRSATEKTEETSPRLTFFS